MRVLAAGALAGLLLVGCSDQVPQTPAAPRDLQREPAEQAFGPTYPDRPPAGRPTRIDTATLSADQRTLTITFVGGKPFLATDPCSEDYEPWVAVRDGPTGEELDVTVINVDRPEQLKLGPNQGCTLEGYGLTYHLALAAPFTGTTANDLADGGTFFVSKPPRSLVATTVPPGWSVQRAFEEEPGPPAIWVEVYAPGAVGSETLEGPGQLVLYQAFGTIGEWSDTRVVKSQARGGHPVAVTLDGAAATVWFDAASGELLLAWTVGGQSVGLVGNAADMTAAQLAGYAEGVVPQAE